ncbi:MAG TPA: hypothetical protein VGN42_03115, partial [Pirellulales bacterium]|nr:hypothetical protein [Pirellulales bacterium]
MAGSTCDALNSNRRLARRVWRSASLAIGLIGASLVGQSLAANAPRKISIAPGADAQRQLQTALIEAQPGDVIELAAGTFDFTATLSLDVAGVTLRGQGPDKTVLSFAGLKQG